MSKRSHVSAATRIVHIRNQKQPASGLRSAQGQSPEQPITGLTTRHPEFDHSVSRQRGVILSLHNGIVAMGLSLIRDLRCLGNNELIQVYHCFPNELSPESRAMLLMDERRLEIIDACTDYMSRGAMSAGLAMKFRNWWLKPLALHHTDLKEVILLDADAIPLRDPAVLRTLPGYVRTGTTFFYDRVINHRMYFDADAPGHANIQYLRQWIETFNYGAFELTGPAPSDHLLHSLAYARKTCHEMDSSMLAVDKRRAGRAMDVLWFLITKKRLEFEFSWGDKEAFWLAYELAHQDYAFSPWGAAVVSSSTNRDMELHPETLCGSMAQYLPIADDSSTPELLYVNGKALLEPFPLGVEGDRQARANIQFNPTPTHVTPRHVRRARKILGAQSFLRYPDECLIDLGATELSRSFQSHLLRRRMFFLAIQTHLFEPLRRCELY